ncbi:MAG: ABC transporter ATP-binding protein, partial [Lactococcus lactis]|nr:ABC transporter ATP-binding protein [Lactococcus lactis]
RNKFALAIDFEEEPPYFEVSPTHFAKTWLLDPRAPKVTPSDNILARWKRWEELKGDK